MEKKNSRIAIIIGTKAELIKCMPIMLELQKQRREYFFIHTSQHNLGDSCEEFGVKRPDYVLGIEPAKEIGTKFWAKIKLTTFLWCIKTMFNIRKIVRVIKPNYVIYHGDTMNTAMAAAGSSSILNPFKKWKNVHLEAGLRSGSLLEPFPEEITRRIVDRFSDLLFAVSDLSEKKLKKEMSFVRGKIKKTGNTIIDSSLITYKKAKKEYKLQEKEYALINLHRYENLKSKKRMRAISEIIKSVKSNAIWPIHSTTEKYFKEAGLLEEIKNKKNVKIIPLVNYFNFIFLLANCKYLITDGGSIQEESLVFKKPCIILRKKTERQEGLNTGINFLTGLDVEKTKEIIKKIETDKIKINNFVNPYGEAGLTKKIVEILK